MGTLSEFFASMPRVEIATSHVTEQDIKYEKNGEQKSFRSRQQFGVLVSRGERTGIEMMREVSIELERDQPPYAAGIYVLGGSSVTVSDRGRLQFSRTVHLVPVPASIFQLVEQDQKRAA